MLTIKLSNTNSFQTYAYSTFSRVHNNKWEGIHFNYYQTNLFEQIESLKSNFNDDKNYVVVLNLKTNDNTWVTLTRHIIIKKETSTQDICRWIEDGIEYRSIKYSISEGNLMIIRYREFTTEINKTSSTFTKKYEVPLNLRKKGDIKSQYLNNKYFPNGFNLENFGKLLYSNSRGGSAAPGLAPARSARGGKDQNSKNVFNLFC